MKILLDHTQNTATQIREYTAPGGGILVGSQGSLQTLPNENVFIGWGSAANVSEYLEDGTPIFFATMDRGSSYRSFKFKWTGSPIGLPALWAFARSSTSQQTVAYMSWNGATEVHSWNVYTVANDGGIKKFELAGHSMKTSFETNVTISGFHAQIFVEAVAANGSSLGNSSIMSTFVPSSKLADFCTDFECPSEPRQRHLKGEGTLGVGHKAESLASTQMEILWDTRLILLLCIVFLSTSIVRLSLRYCPTKKYRLIQQDEDAEHKA
jgi:hypothetical protein